MVHKYPNSIEEAANLLDNVKPDWFEKINKSNLRMTTFCDCILGQLYGDWSMGLNQLFNITYQDPDSIFGSLAEKSDWIAQIDKRLNKVEIHNFQWAVEQMKLGKKVKRKHWDGYYYCYYYSSIHELKTMKIHNNNGIVAGFSIGDFESNDWEIYDERPRFKDLKPGQKFKLPNAFHNTIYTKIYEPSQFNDCKAIDDDYKIINWGSSSDFPVILVE